MPDSKKLTTVEILKESVKLLNEVLLFFAKISDKSLSKEKQCLHSKVQDHLTKTQVSIENLNDKRKGDDESDYHDVVATSDDDYHDVAVQGEGSEDLYMDTAATAEDEVDDVYDNCTSNVSRVSVSSESNPSKKIEVTSNKKKLKQLKVASSNVGSKLKSIKFYSAGLKLKAKANSAINEVKANPPGKKIQEEDIYHDTAANDEVDDNIYANSIGTDENVKDADYVDVEVESNAVQNDKSSEKSTSRHSKTTKSNKQNLLPHVSSLFNSKKSNKASTLPSSLSTSSKDKQRSEKHKKSTSDEKNLEEAKQLKEEGFNSAKDRENNKPSVSVTQADEAEEDAADHDDQELYDDVPTGDLYQGMWDCSADEEKEISFKRGQIVHIISKEYDNDGWWIAKTNNSIGFVPKNYLMEAYEQLVEN